MLHFLLYTGAGSLVMVAGAAAVVTVAVWWTLRLAVSAAAFALWRLWRALTTRGIAARRRRQTSDAS